MPKVNGGNLTSQKDAFVWKLTTDGKFSVKSMYLDILDDNLRYRHKYVWKLKMPLKIKNMWFLKNKRLLTKDNLVKRKWDGCQKFCFCDSLETVEHLFISCPFARIIWRIIFFHL